MAQQVRQGGRYSARSDIAPAFFVAGLENFETLYAPRWMSGALYDNAGEAPVLLDWRTMNKQTIRTPATQRFAPVSWRALRRAAQRARGVAVQTGTAISW